MRRLSVVVLLAMIGALLAACGSSTGGQSGGGSGAPGDALVVKMLYGSEKQAWIEAVTATFNDQKNKAPDGKVIFVEATPAGSGDSMNRILSGQDQPAIWSPASSILIPVANEQWGKDHGGAQLVEGTPPPLVLSPVVIAMWKPMAEALGWPKKPLGWADIANLARAKKTWADYGHAEWGPFQFGHTHPDYSNSGITSILATVYAGAGKTRDLTVADLQKPEVASFLADVERNVIHYGESTGFFAKQMFTRGPSYLSAAVMYENLVTESYDQTKYPNRPLPIVAVYPKEGTFWSDHPFAILNAPWVDANLRAAATTYRDFLLAQPQQEKALQLGFRPSDPKVALASPLTADFGVDPSQPTTLLEVPPANVIEATRALWGQNKKRVEVDVVLDTSGSMDSEQRLVNAKAALKRFISSLADQDILGVTVFSTSSNQLTPLTALGPKRQDVVSQIDGLFASGKTRLYDTVSETYKMMSQQPPSDYIRSIVVLTDGADTSSGMSRDALIAQLSTDSEGRSIKVFTIAYGTGSDVDADFLKQIAEASGAKTYASDPTKIDQVYRDIATFF
jgi:Ca-activated chloride channel family protein